MRKSCGNCHYCETYVNDWCKNKMAILDRRTRMVFSLNDSCEYHELDTIHKLLFKKVSEDEYKFIPLIIKDYIVIKIKNIFKIINKKS